MDMMDAASGDPKTVIQYAGGHAFLAFSDSFKNPRRQKACPFLLFKAGTHLREDPNLLGGDLMPIPLIPLILGGAALLGSALGIKKGVDGVSDIKEAKRRAEEAERRGKAAVSTLENKRSEANRQADAYASLLLDVKRKTFDRFVKFVESLGQKGSMEAIRALEEVNITPPQLQEYKVAAIEAHRVAVGAVSMVASSAGASAGTTGLIGLLGTASTGTAISSLSGVAATNATLAWLGGGSLAAGGGGMALGTVVLGGITVAPALLVGGFVLSGRGAKALTEAKEYESKVSVEVAKVNAVRDFMDRVITRINELKDLIRKLDGKTNQALDNLDSSAFDVKNETDIRNFQQAGLLVKALAEIMKTQVLDGHGQLTGQSLDIQVKYRTLAG
jgi:hypothetical protein